MRYDTDIGAYILDTEEEISSVMDRVILKGLDSSWRQPNGAPPPWIPDSADIIMDDLSTALDKAVGKADPR